MLIEGEQYPLLSSGNTFILNMNKNSSLPSLHKDLPISTIKLLTTTYVTTPSFLGMMSSLGFWNSVSWTLCGLAAGHQRGCRA